MPHPPRQARSPILSLGLLIFGLAGCPGGLDVSRYGDHGPQPPPPKSDGGLPPAFYDKGTKPPGSDAKPISLDLKLPKPDSNAPKPDSKPVLTPDKGVPPGGACTTDANCAAGTQMCISGKCYNRCTTTDPCKVVSKCAANEACVMYNNNPATMVCYPANVAMGGNCYGVNLFCPNGAICGSKDGKTYKCVYTCNNPGAVCAGGTCYGTGTAGCNVCL